MAVGSVADRYTATEPRPGAAKAAMRLPMEHTLVRERPVSVRAQRMIAVEHQALRRDDEDGYEARGDRPGVALSVRAEANDLARVARLMPRAPNPRVVRTMSHFVAVRADPAGLTCTKIRNATRAPSRRIPADAPTSLAW